VLGRVANQDRHGFLKGAGLATMGAALGGFIPAAMAEEPFVIEDKDGLIILDDRPGNAECPAHLLDDEVTPTNRLFVRNNGIPSSSMDADSWTLTIDGKVDQPMELTVAELKDKFEVVTRQLQLECGANGRSFLDPKARGNQWTLGGNSVNLPSHLGCYYSCCALAISAAARAWGPARLQRPAAVN